MSDYTQLTNFAAKDTLLTGNPSKLVRGTEINNELVAIANAINSKANVDSPAFTGTPTATAPIAAGTNTSQLATTAFVTTGFPSTNITFTGDNTHAGLETFRDNKFEITDNSDTTKKVNFELSGLSTATTRTLTVPNKSGTLSLTSDLDAVSALSATSNSIVTGSYSATGSSTITVTTPTANTFAVGQEVFITFTRSGGTGDILTANKFTIVSIISSTQFTISYGSTVTSSGNVTVERYGLIAVANAAEMGAGTSQLKAVTPKLYADSTLGVGQTWQLPTRVIGTSYQNTTGRPIQVCYSFEPSNNAGTTQITAQVSTDNTTWIEIIHTRNANNDDLNYGTLSFIVPNNTYYKITRGGNNIASSIWAELR